jgi:hypothetical protein
MLVVGSIWRTGLQQGKHLIKDWRAAELEGSSRDLEQVLFDLSIDFSHMSMIICRRWSLNDDVVCI